MAEPAMSDRFRGASDAIDMERLEKESQKLLFLGLLVAVSFHAALGSYFMFKKSEVTVARPPMVELVIRRPRMTRAFEFKKERVKERAYEKQTTTVQKPVKEIQTKSVQMTPMGSVTTYDFDTDMDITAGGAMFIPEGISLEMTTTREPEKQISMKEEMISLDDLDTGQYKAMIIQDPQDKQSIKGFIYVATLWGAQLEPANKRAVIHLSDAVNRWTNITSKVDKHLFVDSRRLFDSPFVFLSVEDQFELTDIEARNLGDYLRQGGFALFDNGDPKNEYSAAEASLRKALRDALGSDYKPLPIPNNHALYHCFEDFNDGPPQGAEIGTTGGGTTYEGFKTNVSKQVYYLEGISIDDRLVAIYSDKGYAIKWNDVDDNEPQLRMGVNMVVFALTQEGSIAQQKMDLFSAE